MPWRVHGARRVGGARGSVKRRVVVTKVSGDDEPEQTSGQRLAPPLEIFATLTEADLPDILAMLADDMLGAARDSGTG